MTATYRFLRLAMVTACVLTIAVAGNGTAAANESLPVGQDGGRSSGTTSCGGWRAGAHELVLAIMGSTDPRAVAIREELGRAGITASSSPPGCDASTSPPAPGSATRSGMVVGLVAGSGPPELAEAMNSLKPGLVRLEFSAGDSVDKIAPYIDAYAKIGARVLLLAGFHGALPSAEETRNLGAWAKAFGPASGSTIPVTTIEFGNETSYTYQYNDSPGDSSYASRAAAYGSLAVEASRAIQAADPGVGLVVQADDGDTGSSEWLDNMFNSAPELDQWVTGYTVHPYGPGYATRLDKIRAQLTARNANHPFWITEWGLAADGGRCLDDNYGWDKCMSDDAAASTMKKVASDLSKMNVAAFIVYQFQDQGAPGSSSGREEFFGIVDNSGAPKGALTSAFSSLTSVLPRLAGAR